MDRTKTVGTQEKCDRCGKTFTKKRWFQRFCGQTCREQFHMKRRRDAFNLLEEKEQQDE